MGELLVVFIFTFVAYHLIMLGVKSPLIEIEQLKDIHQSKYYIVQNVEKIYGYWVVRTRVNERWQSEEWADLHSNSCVLYCSFVPGEKTLKEEWAKAEELKKQLEHLDKIKLK